MRTQQIMKTNAILSGILFTAIASVCPAETLLSWDPEGFIYVGENATQAPSPWNKTMKSSQGKAIGKVGIASNVELVKGLTLGSGLNMGKLNNAWGGFTKSPDIRTQEDAIKAGAYITFTVAPKSGYRLSLDEIRMNVRMAGKAEYAYVWQYSLDGEKYVDVTAAARNKPIKAKDTGSKGMSLPKAKLSKIRALQRLESPVSFRLVFWKSEDDESTGTLSFIIGRKPGNDLELRGETKKL